MPRNLPVPIVYPFFLPLRLSFTVSLKTDYGESHTEHVLAANLAVRGAILPRQHEQPPKICLFMCGDVMTGRGIDQILPYPLAPQLHEAYVKDSRDYVRSAEKTSGAIPKPVDFAYIWGDASAELQRNAPEVRIANLETSITQSSHPWAGKGLIYRMNPHNSSCISAAHIDCVVLANNHVLDLGYSGLTETLQTLKEAHVKYAGAGKTVEEASAPAVLDVAEKGRVLVFAYGALDSGVPSAWAAAEGHAGVNLLREYSSETVKCIKDRVKRVKKRGDVAVFSVHWGPNWGYAVPDEYRQFAHRLIDEADIDLVFGHSAHHVKGMEVYAGKLILYGCGDFINDYEGIGGYEKFRGDLSLMYFAEVEAETGKLSSLKMAPMQTTRLRKTRATQADAEWLKAVLNKEGEKLGTQIESNAHGDLTLQWSQQVEAPRPLVRGIF